MDYNKIHDKELKTVLHLLLILQHTKKLTQEEQIVLEDLYNSFPIVAEEKSAIYEHAKSMNWIKAPDYLPRNNGGKAYYQIDSPYMFEHVQISSLGNEELDKLLKYANRWIKKQKQSEYIEEIRKELIEAQIESIKFANQTTQETIGIARSARSAAWASAISAIITALLALIALVSNLYNK